SRRRHTRLQGDWSSDVCSSDLSDEEALEFLQRLFIGASKRIAHAGLGGFHGGPVRDRIRAGVGFIHADRQERAGHELQEAAINRSEERRVGKECRTRWSTNQ